MKASSRLAVSAAAALLATGLTPAAEEPKIYECTDSRGEIVYQDGPCIEPVHAAAPEAAKPEAPVAPVKPARPQKHPVKTPAARKTAPELPKAAPSHQSHALEPPPFGLPVDARWATPAKTLETFVEAVTAGDRALAVACLAGSALADLGPDPEELPLDALQLTVHSFTGYVSEGDLGPFWSIRALRNGLRPKWIFFERTPSGEWKIEGI
jgi:hypothetical protein